MPLVTEPPAVSALAVREEYCGAAASSDLADGDAVRQAAGSISTSGRITMIASPGPRKAASNANPGSGSATLAAPIGVSGEAAAATRTARKPPAAVTMPVLASDRASSWPGAMPSARRTG